MSNDVDPANRQRWTIDSRWILGGFLVVVAFFLITEHRAHLYGILPFLLLLACPLMHLFHGHGGHRHDDGTQRDGAPQAQEDTRS